MWPFKKKRPAAQAKVIKDYEAKGYENKGEITLSDGRKVTIMATPGEYVKRKTEGGDQ